MGLKTQHQCYRLVCSCGKVIATCFALCREFRPDARTLTRTAGCVSCRAVDCEKREAARYRPLTEEQLWAAKEEGHTYLGTGSSARRIPVR